MADLELPEKFADVHFRDLKCADPVERLYYSLGYEPICFFCSSENDLNITDKQYPICTTCALSNKPVDKR